MLKRFDQCSSDLPMPDVLGLTLHGDSDDICALRDHLVALGLASDVLTFPDQKGVSFRLDDSFARGKAPGASTINLCDLLRLDPVHSDDDLEREILLALLLSPISFECACYEALLSTLRTRKNIVKAARNTELAFDTSNAAERPADCWSYSEEKGFTVLPGKSLIDALRKATQPSVSGQRYDFSCYRATEYVILLGIAEELAGNDPAQFSRLQQQWERQAIKSARFHEVFLVEYGSLDAPLPARYYVPGDRLWFRNPDACSSDISGYEGSWVIYLGGGQFSNFWKKKQTYSLASKCLEIYHWRHGVCRDERGELCMDEALVDSRVSGSMSNPDEIRFILGKMMRLRDPQGVYRAGGCIDASREYPRPNSSRVPAYPLLNA